MSSDTLLPFAPFNIEIATAMLDGGDGGEFGVWADAVRDGYQSGINQAQALPVVTPNPDTPGGIGFDTGLRLSALLHGGMSLRSGRLALPLYRRKNVAFLSSDGHKGRYRIAYWYGGEEKVATGPSSKVLAQVASGLCISENSAIDMSGHPPVLIAPNGKLLRAFIADVQDADRSKTGSVWGRMVGEWWSGVSGESIALADRIAMSAVTGGSPDDDLLLSTWLNAFGIRSEGKVLDGELWDRIVGALGPQFTAIDPAERLMSQSYTALLRHAENNFIDPKGREFPFSIAVSSRAAAFLDTAEKMQQRDSSFLVQDPRWRRRMHWTGDAFSGVVTGRTAEGYVMTGMSMLPPRMKVGRNTNVMFCEANGIEKMSRASLVGLTVGGEGLDVTLAPRERDGVLTRAAKSKSVVTMISETRSHDDFEGMAEYSARNLRSKRWWGSYSSVDAGPTLTKRNVPLWVVAVAASDA